MKKLFILFAIGFFVSCQKDNNEPNNPNQQDTIPQTPTDYRDYIIGTYNGTYVRNDINGYHTGTDIVYITADSTDTTRLIFESILLFSPISCQLKSDSTYNGWSSGDFMSGNFSNNHIVFFYDPTGLGSQPTYFHLGKQ